MYRVVNWRRAADAAVAATVAAMKWLAVKKPQTMESVVVADVDALVFFVSHSLTKVVLILKHSHFYVIFLGYKTEILR